MNLFDYETDVLRYVIPYFRQNEDVVYLLKLLAKRFSLMQTVIKYLLNSYNIRNARGIFLDYIGSEVGASRDEVDYAPYFCVNSPDINEEKYFYFSSSGLDPAHSLPLEDSEFIGKIFAYVGANKSSANITDVISIIKSVSGANKVYVESDGTAGLKINIQGNNLILTTNISNYIKQFILGNGIYLKEIKAND